MALLAAFVLQGGGETLENFLAGTSFADAVRTTLQPHPADVEGFRTFLDQYNGLPPRGAGCHRKSVRSVQR